MKRKLGMIGTAAALIMAGLAGTGQVVQSTQAPVQQTQQVREIKSTEPKRQTRSIKTVLQSGGLDILGYNNGYGMSPKEYGMRYGNGNSRQVKHNQLRYSHNAKLKRRTV